MRSYLEDSVGAEQDVLVNHCIHVAAALDLPHGRGMWVLPGLAHHWGQVLCTSTPAGHCSCKQLWGIPQLWYTYTVLQVPGRLHCGQPLPTDCAALGTRAEPVACGNVGSPQPCFYLFLQPAHSRAHMPCGREAGSYALPAGALVPLLSRIRLGCSRALHQSFASPTGSRELGKQEAMPAAPTPNPTP